MIKSRFLLIGFILFFSIVQICSAGMKSLDDDALEGLVVSKGICSTLLKEGCNTPPEYIQAMAALKGSIDSNKILMTSTDTRMNPADDINNLERINTPTLPSVSISMPNVPYLPQNHDFNISMSSSYTMPELQPVIYEIDQTQIDIPSQPSIFYIFPH